MLVKNTVIRSTWQRKVAFLVASVVFVGCRGEGTFFSSILDDGGGFDSGFVTDAGMDASNGCVACETDSGQ